MTGEPRRWERAEHRLHRRHRSHARPQPIVRHGAQPRDYDSKSRVRGPRLDRGRGRAQTHDEEADKEQHRQKLDGMVLESRLQTRGEEVEAPPFPTVQLQWYLLERGEVVGLGNFLPLTLATLCFHLCDAHGWSRMLASKPRRPDHGIARAIFEKHAGGDEFIDRDEL